MGNYDGKPYCTAARYYLDEQAWTAEGQKDKRCVYKQCKACIYYTRISCPTFNPAATFIVRGEVYRETRDYITRIYPEKDAPAPSEVHSSETSTREEI